jgi:hypothetical protein
VYACKLSRVEDMTYFFVKEHILISRKRIYLSVPIVIVKVSHPIVENDELARKRDSVSHIIF